MVLHDRLINEWSLNDNMITPFKSFQVKEGQTGKQISHGLSSYGYDASCSREFKLFTNTNSVVVDPKKFDDTACTDIETDVLIMPPHSFALTRTVEYFKIPASMIAICVGKSTYARCGIIVNVTPLEPEWEGHVTIELTNSTPLPCKIYANEGICQFLFLKGTSFCDVTYKQRNGKYQGQQGITVARC